MTEETKALISEDLQRIIRYYNNEITNLFDEQSGGRIRGAKGSLVENLAKDLVVLTWEKVLQQTKTIKCNNEETGKPEKQPIMIKEPEIYVEREDINEEERIRISNEFEEIKYDFSTDIHVMIDNSLVLAIECKAYAETAMLKRIIFDSMLLDEALPDAKHCIFQLENAIPVNQYHVLMSHHDRNIDVLTLLEGNRNSKKPIHRREHFKALTEERLIEVIDYFESVLQPKAQ